MAEPRLPTLRTDSPREGHDLAVKLARVAVRMTQPDPNIREELRAVYERDADVLIAVSSVIATHFQTVAAANTYWRDRGPVCRTRSRLPFGPFHGAVCPCRASVFRRH